jgi:hypothetical protein
MKNKHLRTPAQLQFDRMESQANTAAWVTLLLFAVVEIVLSRI